MDWADKKAINIKHDDGGGNGYWTQDEIASALRAAKPKWRPIAENPPKIGSEPHALFHGKWILGLRVIKYKDGPVIERKVIRWTEQYPYTKGTWMVAEYYEEGQEIESCVTFEPTHWMDMDEELPFVG